MNVGIELMRCVVFKADTAGEISVKQFRLALALGDVGLEYRCRLYYSLSLMQKGRLREAKDLIRCVTVFSHQTLRLRTRE